jgi:hypothetical protein
MMDQPPARGRPRGPQAPLSAAERMRRMRARRKAAGFRAVTRWEEAATKPATFSSHRLHEARSLAMHAAIARKVEREPALLEIARRNLHRWRRLDAHQPTPGWLKEWTALLKKPWLEIASLMVEPSERAARLRQSSPFAGLLSTVERKRIYEAFRA